MGEASSKSSTDEDVLGVTSWEVFFGGIAVVEGSSVKFGTRRNGRYGGRR